MSAHSGKFKVRCAGCSLSRYGPYVTITVLATKHSLKYNHHVRVFEPGGLLFHDMDITEIKKDLIIPPF